MISFFTILLAGIAGGAVTEHKGHFVVEDLHHLLFGSVFVHLHVLAFHKAIAGLAGHAQLLVK